jgi:Cys-tRNA(Pro)/Cys-tRNA(Cys) deacylase
VKSERRKTDSIFLSGLLYRNFEGVLLGVFELFLEISLMRLPLSPSSKTNACRLLEAKNIYYEARTYTWSEDELDAQTVARKINLPPEQVFKTLVLVGDALPYFVTVIPATEELQLKHVARVTGNKSCSLLPLKELFPLTGYVRGGCSPIGMKKQFPTFVDETADLFDVISISGGARGLQILLSVTALANVTSAVLVNLCPFQFSAL